MSIITLSLFRVHQMKLLAVLLNNFESIDVHWSWDDTQERVQQKVDNFKRLWHNKTDKLEVIDFLNAVAEDTFTSPDGV